MYHADRREKGKGRRILTWIIIIILLLFLFIFGGMWLRNKLRPKVTIKQAAAVTTKINYNSALKHYDEGDFGIDIPSSWKPVPRPPHTYQSFAWQNSDSGTDGQQIEIFEDTIPVNYAVNRSLVVVGENDHISLSGGVSDNCSTFTKPVVGPPNRVGVPAKWENVDFLCDQSNKERDVIGTNSTDGVNVVILHSQKSKAIHKFLFTYTDHSTNPDYTVFYNALQSFAMN